jgi:30S ribosomal protein S31
MGKGDKKTRRGKITIKSYGVTRPRKKKASSKKTTQVIENSVAKEITAEKKKPVATKPEKKETKQLKPGKPVKKSE